MIEGSVVAEPATSLQIFWEAEWLLHLKHLENEVFDWPADEKDETISTLLPKAEPGGWVYGW